MKMHETNKASPFVKKKCIEIMPLLVKYIQPYFSDAHLELSLKAIFAFITKKDNKDRGQGFLSLGKMGLLVQKSKFNRYLGDVFNLLEKEIVAVKPKLPNQNNKNVITLEILTCIKMLLRNFGDDFDKRYDMVYFVNDLFFFGFNKQLIETLAELSKICQGKYKMITQIKLLNAISIILTLKTNHFPIGLDNLKRQKNHDGQIQQQSYAHNQRKDSNQSNSPDKGYTKYVYLRIFIKLQEQLSMIGQSVDYYRKESGDTNTISNALNQEEELKNGLLELQSQNLQLKKDKNGNIQNHLVIDISTLKKLLNKASCEFILSLIQGTNEKEKDKGEQQLNQKTQLVTLALKTLASYDFTEFSDSVTQFIENSVLNYLDDENPTVRKDAVKTCCSLSFSQSNGQSLQRLGAVMIRIRNLKNMNLKIIICGLKRGRQFRDYYFILYNKLSCTYKNIFIFQQNQNENLLKY